MAQPDRGVAVEGPMLERGFESSGLYHPMRHGLTIGAGPPVHDGVSGSPDLTSTDERLSRPAYWDDTDVPWVLPRPTCRR